MEKQESAIPVIAVITGILVVLGIGFWFLAQPPESHLKPRAIARNQTVDRKAGGPSSALAHRAGSARQTRGLGAGMPEEGTPVFAGRDIHVVPLGAILDHAQRLPFDESRGHEGVLGRNARGQTVTASIWPESGASSMEAGELRQGRLVARIVSNHDFEALGLAGGLNYLWVEGREDGGYRGVIIPATAFAPLHDLERVSLTEQTPQGVPLWKGASWVNGKPWIACGRC
jgi:hypothetical protein